MKKLLYAFLSLTFLTPASVLAQTSDNNIYDNYRGVCQNGWGWMQNMMGNMMGNWGWGNSMMGGWGIGFGIFNIIVWILIIIGIIYLIRALAGGGHRCGHMGRHITDGDDNSAINILKERYAKGEIDKAEYEQKKKDLEA